MAFDSVGARQREWTPDEDEILRKGWQGGESSSQIADRLPFRSRSAVIGRRKRLELPERGVTIQNLRKASPKIPSRIKYYLISNAASMTIDTLSKNLGLHRFTVQGHLKTLGLLAKNAKPGQTILEDEPPLADTTPVTLLDPNFCGCRYPAGTIDGQQAFCNAKQRPNSSYCDDHHKRVYEGAAGPTNPPYEKSYVPRPAARKKAGVWG